MALNLESARVNGLGDAFNRAGSLGPIVLASPREFNMFLFCVLNPGARSRVAGAAQDLVPSCFQMSQLNPTVQLERLLMGTRLPATTTVQLELLPAGVRPGACGEEEDREGFGGVDSEGFSEYDEEVGSPPAGRPGEQSVSPSTPLRFEFGLGDSLLIHAHFAALDYMRVLRELVASASDVQEGRTQAVVLLLGSWGSG